MLFNQTVDSLMWLYVLILGLALSAAGYILYRRWQSRRALVARVADLSVLAEIGRAITDAPLDLAQLANIVYRQAGQIVDATIFQLGLYQGDRYRLLIWVVDGEPQPLKEFRLTPDSLGIVGWLRDTRRSLLVRDFESEQDTLPAQPRYISPNPPRSAVFVPLLAADSALGAIAIQCRRRAAFSEEDLRLLTIVANHAAAALAKAQVYEQAQQRAAQLALLGEVTRQINILQPLPSLYRQIVETISNRLDNYEVSFFEQTGEGLRLRATTVGEWKARVGGPAEAGSTAAEAAASRQTVVRESLPELEEGGGGDGLPVTPMAELGAPVVIEDRLWGVLHARSRTGSAFDSNAISLFESLAGQIAFAFLESELYAAEQRRSTELAAIAQISRTIVSALELEELFDDVLDRMEESFGYKRAHIFLLDDDRLVFRAGIGKGAARWAVHGLAYSLDGPGLVAKAGRTRKAALAADTTRDTEFIPGAGLEDTRAEMAAPLLMGNSLLGVFDIQSEKPGRFTADDLRILQTLADTLAVAVRNARLFETERRRRHLAETLRDVSAAVTSTLDLDGVLDLILTSLERVVAYDAASVLLVNENGELILRAGQGRPELREAVGDILDISLYARGESFPATISFGEVDRQHEYHDLLGLPDPHACLGAVLALRDEHLGYLVVDRAGATHFPSGEVDMIAAFASQAAVAIENARLYTAQLEEAWVSTALLQVSEATARATELNEVIQTAARLTPMLVGVERCAVLMREQDAFWVKAFYGHGVAVPNLESTPGFTGQVWPKLQALIDAREVVVIAEHEIADELPVGLSHWFAGVVILLPLLAKGDVQGVLMVGQDLGAVPFTEHRIQLLGGIANQTAVAIESMMLYESQQEEAWVSAALLQVAEAVAQPGALDEGLQAVARLTPMLVGLNRVAIFQWDSGAEVFRASQVAGMEKSQAAELLRMSIAPRELEIDSTTDHHLDLLLPESVAALFQSPLAMVWALRARGDLLGALMVEHVPLSLLGRRLSILDGIARQLALAMENARLTRELALQQKFERDIELARDIQASFLPEACPIVEGWEMCSFWQAARQVGGDFYDFIRLRPDDAGNEQWGLVMADVADKGVPAALFMALSRTLMRTVAISRIEPAVTMSRVNELISADAKTDLFVTIFYALWEPATGRLRYVNAGHNPPVLAGPGREPCLLTGRGVPIGVFDEAHYQEHSIQLDPGEALLFYTDGLPDAVNLASEEFGIERVKRVVNEGLHLSASEILDNIALAVQSHVGVAEAFDDMTMVVLKRKSQA